MDESSGAPLIKEERDDGSHAFAGKMRTARTTKHRPAPYMRSKSIKNEVAAEQYSMGDSLYDQLLTNFSGAENVPLDLAISLLKSKDREITFLGRERQLMLEVALLKAELAEASAAKERTQHELAEARKEVWHIQQLYEGDRAFLNKVVDPSTRCAICLEVMTIPAALYCGHSFCGACVVEWFSQPYTTVTCPVCREFIATRPLLSSAHRDTLAALTGRPVVPLEVTRLYDQGREYDARSDLKAVLSVHVKAACLIKGATESTEMQAEKSSGVVHKELEVQASSPSDGPIHKYGGSLADRLQALRDNGLAVNTTSKRLSLQHSPPVQSPSSPVVVLHLLNPLQAKCLSLLRFSSVERHFIPTLLINGKAVRTQHLSFPSQRSNGWPMSAKPLLVRDGTDFRSERIKHDTVICMEPTILDDGSREAAASFSRGIRAG
ncbi:hypothetical protein F5146DRAFT_1140047 [Armillaria mellea]|nr:hypothetical protein F5146DRAFT_1140047 [Armillaria mellea]